MASGCVKNVATSASHSWTSSKMSVTRESQPLDPHFENDDPVDFEFLLEDPVTMLSADELFSDGKLVPLKFSGASYTSEEKPITSSVVNTAVKLKPCRRIEMEISGVDPYLFSPRAPRCTVRWRELLGLKRLAKTQEDASLSSSSSSSSSSRLSSSSPNPKTASFRHFLNRSSKSTQSPPPPVKDSDISESSSTSISSSRLSLSSSSSSGHELEDLPRLSLDLDKPGTPNPFARPRVHHHHHLRNPNQPRKPRRHSPADESTDNTIVESRGMTVTADSPRLNASGKIVFHGLERSSSSPGNFTGGPRMKHHHGIPRSYSANVRITPVLNVPVSSLRGGPKSALFFGQLFSSSSSSSSGNIHRAQLQQSNTKNRTNRTRLEPTSEL
ncbi:hypothetical protein V5N11_017439 [Cardamine amara subsp. amara]|uniref:Uncharacterized protein n=1 Tax=Cardamine amara subsp. amara TaxID=228776 RepID=A0ABD1ADH5_CARAN